ncbi:MAG: hypothetical protein FJ279_25425, partial [Planctomycetes bacterium]|nr:hypothetical protein [Planctomycetota bacterium]
MAKKTYGARCEIVSLGRFFNWPSGTAKDEWWQKLAEGVQKYPAGKQRPWGIPFLMAEGAGPRVILVSKDSKPVTIALNRKATHVCLLHAWAQLPSAVRMTQPQEGLPVAEYELTYADGSKHVQPVRGRFEVAMAESPGPPWLAMAFNMWSAVNPVQPPQGMQWGRAQTGLNNTSGVPLVYALP